MIFPMLPGPGLFFLCYQVYRPSTPSAAEEISVLFRGSPCQSGRGNNAANAPHLENTPAIQVLEQSLGGWSHLLHLLTINQSSIDEEPHSDVMRYERYELA